jgi:hypothetical protein
LHAGANADCEVGHHPEGKAPEGGGGLSLVAYLSNHRGVDEVEQDLGGQPEADWNGEREQISVSARREEA